MTTSAVENERLNHINLLMNEFHTHTSNIYEHLVDREIPECQNEIKEYIVKLKELQESLGDGT